MKIGLDLGHGVKYDWGADGRPNGCLEEDIINSVAANMIDHFRNTGHEVILLRPTTAFSTADSLNQRCITANDNNVDVVLSIHANAGGGTGTEIYTFNCKDAFGACYMLAEMEKIGFRNRGIKNGNELAVISNTTATALLVEVCFCDNHEDVILFQTHVDEIARIIVSGVTGNNIVQAPEVNHLYRVQLGAFRKKENADRLLEELKGKGYDGIIV